MTHRGPANGRVFLRFVKRHLVPWLNEGDVVVMDNLSAHKMVAVRKVLAAAGARALYLPTYSPELNPIELLWADMKRRLRSLAINAEDELRRAVRRLRAATPIAKIRAWFRHSYRRALFN